MMKTVSNLVLFLVSLVLSSCQSQPYQIFFRENGHYKTRLNVDVPSSCTKKELTLWTQNIIKDEMLDGKEVDILPLFLRCTLGLTVRNVQPF